MDVERFTRSQYLVLEALVALGAKDHERLAGSLAKALDESKAAICKVLRELERKGYVRRRGKGKTSSYVSCLRPAPGKPTPAKVFKAVTAARARLERKGEVVIGPKKFVFTAPERFTANGSPETVVERDVVVERRVCNKRDPAVPKLVALYTEKRREFTPDFEACGPKVFEFFRDAVQTLRNLKIEEESWGDWIEYLFKNIQRFTRSDMVYPPAHMVGNQKLMERFEATLGAEILNVSRAKELMKKHGKCDDERCPSWRTIPRDVNDYLTIFAPRGEDFYYKTKIEREYFQWILQHSEEIGFVRSVTNTGNEK